MNVLGTHLTVLIGPTIPVPAPLRIAEALETVEVRHSDEGRSVFQLGFRIGRSGPADLLDYPLIRDPLLRPFNRVTLVVTVEARPHVLIDGIVTNQQHAVSAEPGAARLTLTGDDVTYAMDRDEKSWVHPGQGDGIIARKLIGSYPQYGMIPEVPIDPPGAPPRSPSEKVPTQQGSDLDHLQEMARRHRFVFFVTPGPVVGINRGYWGPPPLGPPQRALSVNLGSATNVESIDFQYNALAPELFEGWVQDGTTNTQLPVRVLASTRLPRAAQPALVAHRPMVRTRQFRQTGVTGAEASALAQARTDASTDEVVTATGQLDAARYGDLLRPRALVGVRGAGYSYDGHYYVKSVTHTITKGSYRQGFTLTREGLGSTTPTVIP